MNETKFNKERLIENHLRHYKTYKVAILNCKKQLDYIFPSLVARYESDGASTYFYISNDTEKVAIDRIESKRALDLNEAIQHFELICDSIDRALEELREQERAFVQLRYFNCETIDYIKNALGYSEEKSVYRIRRHVLDKLLISLSNLANLK